MPYQPSETRLNTIANRSHGLHGVHLTVRNNAFDNLSNTNQPLHRYDRPAAQRTHYAHSPSQTIDDNTVTLKKGCWGPYKARLPRLWSNEFTQHSLFHYRKGNQVYAADATTNPNFAPTQRYMSHR